MPRLLLVGLLLARYGAAEDDAEDANEEAMVFDLNDTMDEEGGDEEMQETKLDEHELTALYSKMDLDGDGKVSREEMRKFVETTNFAITVSEAKEMAKEIDKDQDGKISLKEAEEAFAQGEDNSANEAKMKAADVDNDGFISTDELGLLLTPDTTNRLAMDIHMQEAMKGFDPNGDGKVTEEEFGGHPEGEEGHFNLLDVNKDGILDSQELEPMETRVFHDQQTISDLFKHSDLDSDGHVTHDEIQKGYAFFQNSEWHNTFAMWADQHIEL